MSEWEPVDRTPPRRVRVVAAVAAALAVGAAVALTQTGTGEEGEPSERPGGEVTVEQDAETPAAPNPAQEVVDDLDGTGEWAVTPEAPIPPRRGHVAVWTGSSMLVWGGFDEGGGWHDDGALHDPHTGEWRELPAAPAPPAADTVASWTGDELVVVGADGDRHFRYAPDDARWRDVSDPPGPASWLGAASLGDRLVLLGRGDDGLVVVAYDGASDSWQDLPPPPLEAAVDAVVAVGGRLVVIGGDEATGDVVTVLDPATGEWSRAGDLPVSGDWTPVVAGDPSRYEFLLAGPAHGRGNTHAALSWALGAGPGEQWERLPALSRDLSRAAPQLFPVDDGLVAWGVDDPDAGAWLDEAGNSWESLQRPPQELSPGGRAVWTGDELLVWGGSSAQGASWTPTAGGAVELPRADAPRLDGTWELWAEPPERRHAPALAWGDDGLFALGGRDEAGQPHVDGVHHDRASGEWRRLPEAPVAAEAGDPVVWTGDELLVWGRQAPAGPRQVGAAYDPVADDWRLLPETSLPADGEAVGTVGDDVMALVAGSPPRAEAYDMDGDRWQAVPDPPARAGSPLGLASTPQGMVLVAEGGSWVLPREQSSWAAAGSSALEGRLELGWDGHLLTAYGGGDVARLDPARGSWTGASSPWRRSTDSTAAWTGSAFIVWGAATVGDHIGGRVAAAAYEPSTDTWKVLPDPPPHVDPTGPAVRGEDGVVFWSAFGPPVAFEPGKR